MNSQNVKKEFDFGRGERISSEKLAGEWGFFGTVFRGFADEITQALNIIDRSGELEIVERCNGQILDLYLQRDFNNEIRRILYEFPSLKMVTFYAFKDGSCGAYYSHAGYPYITKQFNANLFVDSSDDPWIFVRKADETQFSEKVNMWGELQYMPYFFLEESDWNLMEDYDNYEIYQTIGVGESEIPFCAYMDNEELKNIKISEGVTLISGEAFLRCSNLESVILPESLETIDAAAFAQCHSLKNVKMNKNIRCIEEYAFDECQSLETIILPEGIEYIYECAFSNCQSLKSVKIGNKVKFIGDGAFENCEKLIIQTKQGSIADLYAKENDIKVEYI